MKKLNPILHSKSFICFLFVFTFFFVLLSIQKKDLLLKEDYQGILKITSIKKESEKTEIIGEGKERLILFTKGTENLELGDLIFVKGIKSLPSTRTNFYLFSYLHYLKSKKINYQVQVSSIERIEANSSLFYQIKNAWIEKIETYQTKKYLYAFLLGDTSYLEKEVMDSFRNIGISHLFAISGMHISFISFFILKFLSFLFKNKNLCEIICFFLLLLYTAFASFAPSLLRATLFWGMKLLNQFFHLKLSNQKLLFFLACFFLLYNPFYIYHIGFLFSFIISFFLISSPFFLKKENSYIKKTFLTSLLSFAASLPILARQFFSFNICTPLYNLILIPFVSFLLFPLSFLTFFMPIFSPFYEQVCLFLEKMTFYFSSLPTELILPRWSFVLILFYYLLLYVFVRYKNKVCLYGVCFIFFINFFLPFFRIYHTITMIDVGQGDSILMELKNGKNILIDTGGNTNKQGKNAAAYFSLIPYLKARGIYQIDLLILTHGDADHAGDAVEVMKEIKVKKILMNCGNTNELERKIISYAQRKRIPVKQVSTGQIKVKKNPFLFLNEICIKNENDDSLIVYTNLGNHHILFMGDASKEIENKIMRAYSLLHVDILKVGHHGSKTSTSEDFVRKIKPKYSLISVKQNNIYGHPSPETLQTLKENHSHILSTAENGMIKLILKKKIEVKTCL